MEAKSQEYAAYRFHRKARLMARMMFFYNIGAGNYGLAFVYHFTWTWETMMSQYHRKRIVQTAWYEKSKGKRIRALGGD